MALDDFRNEGGAGKRGNPGWRPACDTAGALLPFPYAAGAGYIMSRSVLRWVATSEAVGGWVREAAGDSREELQWQKYEDTTLGYWLLFAPFARRMRYVDVTRWVHNLGCSKRGQQSRTGGDLNRPTSNLSVLVHDLKKGGFHFAWSMMPPAGAPYDHAACQADLYSIRKGQS
jgi:hypothetical protein